MKGNGYTDANLPGRLAQSGKHLNNNADWIRTIGNGFGLRFTAHQGRFSAYVSPKPARRPCDKPPLGDIIAIVAWVQKNTGKKVPATIDITSPKAAWTVAGQLCHKVCDCGEFTIATSNIKIIKEIDKAASEFGITIITELLCGFEEGIPAPYDPVAVASENSVKRLLITQSQITPRLVDEARDNCIKIQTKTNDPKTAERLLRIDVESITTDDAAAMYRALTKKPELK